MAGNIKGIIVEIGGDTSGLQKALSKVNSASSSLSKELRGINSLLKLDPKNTELLAQKQVILSKNVETTKNKLNQLKDIQAKALEEEIDKNEEQQENWRALQREIINTQNKLNKFLLEQSGWTTSGRKIEEFGKKIEGIGSKLDNLGSKFTTRLTLPITALGAVVTKSGMEQEAAIQQVEKIYGEASKTIKDFANNTALSYNMSTKSAYKYSQIFGNLIQTITDDQAQNAQYTQELLKASSVIASATGRTMEDVMDRIRSGLLGNTEAIEDLGVNVNVALLESTESFKKFAGDKSWNQLDFQIQQQIRLFAILEQTTKKYGDEVNVNTTSKVQKLTAKLENLGNKLSSKLLPVVDKWLDKADKWLDKLDDLDEETLDNIISIGLFVAAFGPAIKIIGKLTNTIGTGIKGLGRFTQAIAVVKTGSESANKSVNKMATGIKGLISPVGLATTTLALYSAGVGIVQAKIADEVKENKEFISTIEASTGARKDAIETINKNQNANLAEINNVQTLNNELKELVNENGKVKSGYEARVQFILNQLNNALGTEFSLNDNIINQYQNMQSSIDELIKKKEAQIILEANEEKYKEAIQNKTQAYKDYLSTQEKINEILPIYNKLLEDNQKGFIGSNYSLVEGKLKLKEYTDELKTLYSSLEEQESIMEDYNNDILQFQKNSELMIKGGAENYQKIAESVAEIQSDITTTSNSELSKRINNLIAANEQTKKLYQLEAQYNKKAKDSIYAKNLEESEKNLQLAIDDLIAMTSTTKEMSPNVIEAWKNLAQNSRKEYNEALSKMPVDMQERINNITDTLNNDISTRDAAKFLGNDIVKNFDQSVEAEKAGKNLVSGVNKGLNNKTEQAKAQNSARTFSSTILNIFHRIWDEHSPSKASEKSAINLLKGVPIGLNKEAPKVYEETEKVVKNILEKFNSNLNFNTLENLPDINTSIKRSINMTLQPKILQPNIVINTQHLDNSEMNRIIDTVNRRFGMQI